MERVYIKILFSFILSLCGFSSLLLIRSNQTSTETVTRVSSAQGIPLKPLSVVNGVPLCRVPRCIRHMLGIDQNWLPLLGQASVPCCLWDEIEARLGCACSWPKHQYLELGWESTPQNPIFVFSAQLRAAPSFSGGTAQIWHMSQHCKAAPATFSDWRGAVKMKKLPPFQAWYLMAWAELVSSSSAQGVRPLAVISCGQEATSTFISQLMETEEDYLEEHNMFWRCRTLHLLTSDTEQVDVHPGLPPVRCFAWSYDLLSSVIHYILTARANGRCTPARP